MVLIVQAAVVPLLAIAVVFAATEISHAQDDEPASVSSVRLVDPGWPFVRGRTFDGHSAAGRIADAWPVDGPSVLWTCELGQGYSAFVAVADAGDGDVNTAGAGPARVFTQAQTLAGQVVLCLNAETIWSY
jgi:hypothetical protein